MQKQFYFLAVALLSLLTFSSCQKTDVLTTQQNIEGTWVITGITSDRAYDFNGDGRTETDIYANYNSCQRDIVVTFQANGYGQMRQGCNAAWQNMTWRLSNNNRNLTIILPDDQLNLDLSQFDDYSLRGTDQVTLNGNNFYITYQFQRR